MKTEKREDGTEVHVFEKRPWEEAMPCWYCKKRKEPPEEYPESGYHGRISIALGRMAFWFANRAMRRFHRKAKRCGGCEKLKKWQERQDYWSNRLNAGLVEQIKRRAEDDKRTEKRVDGEADKERDTKTDAKD